MVNETLGTLLSIPEERIHELIVLMGEMLEGKTKINGTLDLINEVEKEEYSISEVMFIGIMLGKLI